jgi:hypothetical protein
VIQEYAGVNEIPNADAGDNVEAFYLVENNAGDRVLLIYPPSGNPWHVGETGVIPCDQEPVGLQVVAHFPQQTFLAGVIGIAQTNVKVDASAEYDTLAACANFVLLSLSDDSGQGTLDLSGADVHVHLGGIHSNGGLHVTGSDLTVDEDRPVEYGDGAQNNSNDLNAQDRIKEGKPVSGEGFWVYSDFTDGGLIYQQAAKMEPSLIHEINGNLEESDVMDNEGNLIDGLYIVSGDVHLNQLSTKLNQTDTTPPWRVTIATEGCVQFSGGNNTLPYAGGVLIFADCDNTAVGAVKMSGDENKWAGLIIAPNGDVNMSSAANSDLSGMIVAQHININGSNNVLQHNPGYCPPEPPTVTLIQ